MASPTSLGFTAACFELRPGRTHATCQSPEHRGQRVTEESDRKRAPGWTLFPQRIRKLSGGGHRNREVESDVRSAPNGTSRPVSGGVPMKRSLLLALSFALLVPLPASAQRTSVSGDFP